MPVLQQFSERLKEIRQEKGLTQDEMSTALGCSRMSYVYYENGKRTPDIDFLSKLIDYTGYEANYFLGKTIFKNQKVEADALKLEGVLADFYGVLNDEQKQLFHRAIINILVSFVLFQDTEWDKKEWHEGYAELLNYIAAFYNTYFGVYDPNVFEKGTEPWDRETKARTLYISAFELKNGLDNLIFDRLGIEEGSESEAIFQIDYTRCVNYMKNQVADIGG